MATSTTLHSVRFPGETASYRDARNELLEAEINLRRNIEEVAALRRKLPVGGAVPEDYAFEEGPQDLSDSGPGKTTRISELFQHGKDTLALYSFMYGPNMAAACPSCTSILDGLNGVSIHLTQQINLAVVAKSPLQRIREFARERGWHNLRLLSSNGNTYNHDYHGETADGNQIPSLSIFVRRDGKVHHFYQTELMFVPKEPGQDPRHVDSIWPVWNLLDFTPEGRLWRPKLKYS